MNNTGKMALARAIVSAIPSLNAEEQTDLIFTTMLELDSAIRKNAATSIALAEESIAAGNVYAKLGVRLAELTKANGAPLLPIIEALGELEVAARDASKSLDGRELFGMGEERIAAIMKIREALARIDLARAKPAAEGGDRAETH